MPSRAVLNVSPNPELSGYVAVQVASERYRTASELVRAALRLLQDDKPLVRGASVERAAGKPAPVPRRRRPS